MPLFEYVCKKCGHAFEALIFGKQKAVCPKCQSQQLERQLSTFSAAVASPASAALPCASGACSSGACSSGHCPYSGG